MTGVQIVTKSPASGTLTFRVMHTTCCAHIQKGGAIVSTSTTDTSIVIPMTPGSYDKITFFLSGDVTLTIAEIRLFTMPVPTGLAAVPGDGQAALSWNAVSSGTLAGYRVYQDGMPITVTSDTYYTATGLLNGQTYSFAVASVDIDNIESPKANLANVKPRDATIPAAPVGLTATAGNGQVKLEWTPNGESDLERYVVYKNGTAYDAYVEPYDDEITDDTKFTLTIAGLANGTSYDFQVSAVDKSGNESPRSALASATPSDPPPTAPTGLTATPGDRQVSLTWDDNEEADFAKYKVYRDGVLLDGSITTNVYVATGLTNDTAYSFSVTAVDTSGNESAPAETSATPKPQSIRLVIPSTKLSIGEEAAFRVELLTAGGTYQDVTDAVYGIDFSEPNIVSFEPDPHRFVGLSTGKVHAVVHFQTYSVTIPLYVNYDGWVKSLVNPTTDQTSVAHVIRFASEQRLDLNDDHRFDRQDVLLLLQRIEPWAVAPDEWKSGYKPRAVPGTALA